MLNNGNNSMGPADFAAMMGNGGFGGFGGDGIWGWFLIALLFGMWGGGGFFGNGWGNGGSNSGAQAGFYATQADLQRGFDQAALANKIDNLGLSLEHNINDPGYMITNSFAQAELSRANNQAALLSQMNNIAMMEMQDTNSMQEAINSNANATQVAIMQSANQAQANTAQMRYDMATSDCAIKTAIAQAVDSINQNANANYRQLHDEMTAEKMAALQAQIANQQSEISALRLAASQADQNQYLINQLRPAAIPAYQVPNPYYGYGFQYGCGCNG